jgi:hypothetical protein
MNGGSDEIARRRTLIETFVRHEAFHFWNGWLFEQDPAREQPWLSEGSAEFAALSSALRQGVIDGAEFDAVMSSSLNQCRDRLQDKLLTGPAGAQGKVPYVCGTALQWIASLDQTSRGASFERFFALWRGVFTGAKRESHLYSADRFLSQAAASDPARAPALDLLAKSAGLERWPALVAEIGRMGVPVSNQLVDAGEMRSRMIMHLLGQFCSGRYGYFTNDGYLKLDTGTRCAPAPADPEVDTVEGMNIFSETHAAYERVATRCARSEPVLLSRGSKDEGWRLPCQSPLAPPYDFAIATAD